MSSGLVIVGIVFHELFAMLRMEYPVAVKVNKADLENASVSAEQLHLPIQKLCILYGFFFAHLVLVFTTVTACMVRT
jgi:hypothetical protein